MLLPLFGLSLLCLSSCTIYDLFGSSASNSTSYPEGAYYKADNVTPFSYRDINLSQGIDAVPSTGDVELLVLPIEISGYSFPTNFSTDLEHVLNGDGATDTGYWESLSSFYKKSSYGKLNIHYTVADNYASGYTANTLYSYNTAHASDNGAPAPTMLLQKGVAAYKSKNGNTSTQAFDSQGDGLIDGVIMVYSCPDMSSSSTIGAIDRSGDLYWAFTYWDYNNVNRASASSPIACTYFWMSYDFIYEAVSSPKVDAHTLIHESGHMMGLDDYYAESGNKFNPAGGWQMMDENILDHDVFSKMALGWTNPYVVTDSCQITINPSEDSGDCVLIGTSWNGTAFDEYMLLELYTPTGLNYLDSHTKYSSREMHYTTYGVKLYHVDARIMATSDGNNYSYFSGTSLTNTKAYVVGATNCQKDYSPADSDFNLLRLISADGLNTFEKGTLANEDSLFETGDTFNMTNYSSYFPKTSSGILTKTAIFDNGASFPYTISFDSVTATSATITFTKK